MMIRPECLKVLAAHRADEIVVSIFQPAFEWLVLSPSDLNYTFVGAMGQTASHALGLALAFPERRVIVLDGDGSLLMNLGCLVTIAAAAPRNLTHLVCNNGTYETTGGQLTPGLGCASLPDLARAAGYPVVHQFDDLSEFEKAVPSLRTAKGPVFADLKVVPGSEKYPQDWSIIHDKKRQMAFKRAALSGASIPHSLKT